MVVTSRANQRQIAYFSMEVGLDPRLPTYSGGLGILAGDTLKAAADLGAPMVAVSLLYRKGYFKQGLSTDGKQQEEPVSWNVEELLQPVEPTVNVTIAGRKVQIKAWRYDIKGAKGHILPLYFLDTSLGENSPEDQRLTDHLYGGDEQYRLNQEIVLGQGGVKLLTALGHGPSTGERSGLDVYHMNEGHSALLTLALLEHRLGHERYSGATPDDLSWVKSRAVFTTHTPVPAGHDTFDINMVKETMGADSAATLQAWEVCPGDRLNMSHLALKLSRYANGVAKRHGEVSRRMFPGQDIEAITNGVHGESWTADSMRTLFDKYMPYWREDNFYLRHACEIPLDEIRQAHTEAKQALFTEVQARTGVQLKDDVFTIGFARRATEYKRADLLFHDLDALKKAVAGRKLQIIYAGKAHPKDMGGKALIEKVVQAATKLSGSEIEVVYVPNYDMQLGRLIVSGVDLWLNNPVKPLEASGTSGMKAAMNGVPNFSTLDGWWIEGCVEGVTGWEIVDRTDAFGSDRDSGEFRDETARDLYAKLGGTILPMYLDQPDEFAKIMRQSIFLNGPAFSTHRMVTEYMIQAYQAR